MCSERRAPIYWMKKSIRTRDIQLFQRPVSAGGDTQFGRANFNPGTSKPPGDRRSPSLSPTSTNRVKKVSSSTPSRNGQSIQARKGRHRAPRPTGRQKGGRRQAARRRNQGAAVPHAIVAGVERYPRKVTRRMGQKKLAARSKVKPFIKVRRPCP
ncbi:hypothetical protein BDZ89DRAFT_831392 [Hymenopellis radicata]|nr:hypothetical protein BDZ89DRAFT_831392 [Hymenopellis radicata]